MHGRMPAALLEPADIHTLHLPGAILRNTRAYVVDRGRRQHGTGGAKRGWDAGAQDGVWPQKSNSSDKGINGQRGGGVKTSLRQALFQSVPRAAARLWLVMVWLTRGKEPPDTSGRAKKAGSKQLSGLTTIQPRLSLFITTTPAPQLGARWFPPAPTAILDNKHIIGRQWTQGTTTPTPPQKARTKARSRQVQLEACPALQFRPPAAQCGAPSYSCRGYGPSNGPRACSAGNASSNAQPKLAPPRSARAAVLTHAA